MPSHWNSNLSLGCLALAMAAGNMLFSATPASAVENPAGRLVVYVGTYNGPKSRGIYEYEFDPATGAMTAAGEPAEITNSSFMAIHPNGKYLYSVIETENFRGKNSGGLKSFAINAKSGQLTPLNEQSSEGGIPCHLVVDPTGQHVLVANYNGGTFTAVAIEPDGKLGPVEAVHMTTVRASTANDKRRPIRTVSASTPRANSSSSPISASTSCSCIVWKRSARTRPCDSNPRKRRSRRSRRVPDRGMSRFIPTVSSCTSSMNSAAR